MSDLSQLLKREPLLDSFLASVKDIAFGLMDLDERLAKGFLAADEVKLSRSLEQLAGDGILPNLDPQRADHVEGLWKSYLFRVLLDSIGFYPPPDADPLAELLEPVARPKDLRKRAAHVDFLFPEIDYWRFILKRTYPEVFLNPFLGDGPLVGCDLACGWGRATLALRQYGQRHVHCCDHFQTNLERLAPLVARAGLSERVTPHLCEIDRLPFEDDGLDFTIAFDIFELLTDELFERVLQELLRCNKVGAVLYCKVTLFAMAPSLGQVQNFTPQSVLQRFTEPTQAGKRLVVKQQCVFTPEHFTFEVV